MGGYLHGTRSAGQADGGRSHGAVGKSTLTGTIQRKAARPDEATNDAQADDVTQCGGADVADCGPALHGGAGLLPVEGAEGAEGAEAAPVAGIGNDVAMANAAPPPGRAGQPVAAKVAAKPAAGKIELAITKSSVKPKIIHDLTSKQISALAKRGGAANAGLTRVSRTLADAGTSFNGDAGSLWVEKIYADLKHQEITVYIASEYAEGSCEYKETLKHELEHVKAAEETLTTYRDEMEQALRSSLGTLPSASKPFKVVANRDSVQKTYENYIEKRMKEVYGNWKAELIRRNDELDSAASYAKVHDKCKAW